MCLWQKWFGGPGNPHLFLSPSSSLVSCDLFVSMRVIHQKQLKLSELYATLYHSLCRCLIPPLYTMFMPTTLCHIKYFVECFRWLLYAVLCCFIPMWGMFHTLLYAGFMFVFSSIQLFSITYSRLFYRFLSFRLLFIIFWVFLVFPSFVFSLVF